MSTFVVTYKYKNDSEDARTEQRPKHVEFLRGLHTDGVLYMSGPLAEEPPRAMLVFEDADADALVVKLDGDPFAVAGLIAERTVTPWNVFFDPRKEG